MKTTKQTPKEQPIRGHRALPTKNKEWGFWGSWDRYHPDVNGSVDRAWVEAANVLINPNGYFRLSPSVARDLLDSRWGRHLADLLQIVPPRAFWGEVAKLTTCRWWMKETLQFTAAVVLAQTDDGQVQ
jgi:hypothetical protein